MAHRLIWLLAIGLACAWTSTASVEEELLDLYRQRDFFELRKRLADGVNGSASAESRFLAAAVEHAFNRPAESNRLLDHLRSDGLTLSDELRSEAARLRFENHLRRHEYSRALEVGAAILRATEDHPGELIAEVGNTARLLAKLRGVPPQTLVKRSTTRLKLDRLRRRVAVGVDGSRVEMALDTGANFSVLMESVARRIGLTVREVGLKVATSTGRSIPADVAVAHQVSLGRAEFRNVVFLVFPDQLLTFADGTRLEGLIGFPVLAALGEVQFHANDLFEVPERAPSRKMSNLALDGLELLVSGTYQKEEVVCRLDTGSDRTFFYAPFYERFRGRVDAVGEPRRIEAEGVGGTREIDAFLMPPLTLNVARAGLRLGQPLVYAEPLSKDSRERLDCNLGVDLFGQFRYYAINFEDMALVLGPALSPRRGRRF